MIAADSSTLGAIALEPQHRFVLTQVADTTLLFPASWVTETLILERSRLLALPFFNPAFMGCFHHAGQFVPLLSTHQILNQPANLSRENLIILRLSDQASHLAGIGLLIDKVLGTKTVEQLSPDFLQALQNPARFTNPGILLFDPNFLQESLFHPLRWVAS